MDVVHIYIYIIFPRDFFEFWERYPVRSEVATTRNGYGTSRNMELS